MSKQEIRQLMIRYLKSLSPQERVRRSQELTDKLILREDYQKSQRIATFLSMSHEWDTFYLIEHAQSLGKEVLIPKTFPKGKLLFLPYQPDQLIQTSFGTWEPADASQAVEPSAIDWLQVPGLAWNSRGFRIGYGGGFYDRFLSHFKGVTLSSFADFQYVDFQEEFFDQPVEVLLISESCTTLIDSKSG